MIIDVEQCKNLAVSIDKIDFVTNEISPFHFDLSNLKSPLKENFLFLLIAICHDTKGLQGMIDNRILRGWDYLSDRFYAYLKEKPERFKPENLINWDIKEFKELLIDQMGNQVDISGIQERIMLIRDLGKKLKKIGGSVSSIYNESGGFLSQENGILTHLKEFKAYRDPLLKKSMVFIKFAMSELGWEVKDPGNFVIPVDYHNQRIALRYGLIELPEELEEKLRKKEEVTSKEHFLVRKACQEAFQEVVKLSKFGIFEIDSLIWLIGRNCCSFDKDPCCTICRKDKCTIENFITNSNRCPLAAKCYGTSNIRFKKLNECNFKTDYY
ncbi:MAG: N-glycosylase/DNA lyase [Candidatus Ranarchaeia archaeon]